MRIALAQINTTVGDLKGNAKKILDAIHAAQARGADMVVFPEMAVTGYPPEDLLFKEHFVHDNLKTLKALAKDVKRTTAIIGFVDQDRQKNLYNAAAVISGGRIRGIYHKQDLPNYGVFDEKRYFHEGKEAPVFCLDHVVFGVNICEDIWKERGIPYAQARQGAKVIINLSSSPYDFGKLKARENMLIARAKATKAYICYVNLVGGQDELVFDGGSLVINPKGEIIASGRQFEEDLVIVDLPVKSTSTKRKIKNCVALPSFRSTDREPIKNSLAPRYGVIERIYKALVLGTRDYMGKNGFRQAVVGLSGGIDSSIVAKIAVDAIGQENVIGVSMPSPFTSIGTKTDGQALANNLGIRFMEIPIKPIFDSYLDVLKDHLAGHPFSVAEENLQARIRGNILMTFSNKFGWLVLTTGNKSEVAVGYCTLYGDMSGGFAVIKDVPKTKVYEIAHFINKREGNVIPASILTRPPTAELRPNQKDEDSLPPYAQLDPLLKAYVEDHQSLQEMAKTHPNMDVVKDVIRLVDRSEYKRRQSPPGIKITPRAFGKDWRLPITNKYKEF